MTEYRGLKQPKLRFLRLEFGVFLLHGLEVSIERTSIFRVIAPKGRFSISVQGKVAYIANLARLNVKRTRNRLAVLNEDASFRIKETYVGH
jgi:hypothetical protein